MDWLLNLTELGLLAQDAAASGGAKIDPFSLKIFDAEDLLELVIRFALNITFVLALSLLLAGLYQLSLSQDTSYTPSWLLWFALLVWAVLSAVSGNTRLLTWWLLVAGMAGLAIWSTVQYWSVGLRASMPVNDPNNYASALYLLWIPSAHIVLARRWAERPLRLGLRVLALAGTALMMFTMFATESREIVVR